MAQYNFRTFKQIKLWRNSHIFAVYVSQNLPLNFKQKNVTELDFVFDNKIVREYLKKY